MAEKIKTTENKNLKTRFRFVVLNDETFEEKFSLKLTHGNIWVFASVLAFTLIFLTAAAIIYTPLKYFIPGYGDYNYRSEILQLQFKTDSLETVMMGRQAWLDNITNIVSGKVDSSQLLPTAKSDFDKSKINLNAISENDKKLRKEVEDEENFSLSLSSSKSSGAVYEVQQMHMIAPVQGYLTDEYNIEKGHYGIDIAATKDAPVKTVLDGRIVSADYTLETGYVIAVQHANNLISLYKHNSKLLKKVGESVKAGDVIAVVGNTGELSSGPHLHFELWYNGKSLNPKDYIAP